MRELSKKDFRVIESFISNYTEILKEILAASDVDTEAQHQAWIDWSIEKLVEEGELTNQVAKVWMSRIESYYKVKKHD